MDPASSTEEQKKAALPRPGYLVTGIGTILPRFTEFNSVCALRRAPGTTIPPGFWRINQIAHPYGGNTAGKPGCKPTTSAGRRRPAVERHSRRDGGRWLRPAALAGWLAGWLQPDRQPGCRQHSEICGCCEAHYQIIYYTLVRFEFMTIAYY
eukprot:SAG25_NODE_459_length_7828_cov_24.263907_10_plen_152_part_00